MVYCILHIPEDFTGGDFILAIDNGSLVLAAGEPGSVEELVQKYKLFPRIGGGHLEIKHGQIIFSGSSTNYGGISTPHMRELACLLENSLKVRFPGTSIVCQTHAWPPDDPRRVEEHINKLLHPAGA